MDDQNDQPRMSLPIRLLLSGVVLCTAGYFARQTDYVLAAVITAISIGCFSGFRLGATRILGSLVGFVAAVAFAPSLGRSIEWRFTEWVGTTGLTNRFLSIGVVGLAIVLGLTILIGIIATRIFRHRHRLALGNCWLGFAIGGIQGTAACMLLLGGILMIEPLVAEKLQQADPDVPRPPVLKYVQVASQQIHASRLGPVMDDYNPFERVPQLNQFDQIQRSVQVLSDPRKMNDILHHPSVQELQQQPAMQKAVESLRADPEIREILNSGRPMDRATAMSLMSHPAVMELVDQPGFIEQVSEILKDANLESRPGIGPIRPGMVPFGPGVPLSFQ